MRDVALTDVWLLFTASECALDVWPLPSVVRLGACDAVAWVNSNEQKGSAMARVTDTTVEGYLDVLASTEPVPGGGGVAALAGSLACALGCMVAGLTIGKPAYAEFDETAREALATCEQLRHRMLDLSNADADGFRPVTAALKLPRSTDEERAARSEALNRALLSACEAPLEVLESAQTALEALHVLAEHGTKIAVVDVGVAASLARTAADGAALTVHANAGMMTDAAAAAQLRERADQLMGLTEVRSREVYITAKLRFS